MNFINSLFNRILFHFQVRWWTQIGIRYREELELCSFFSDVELVWIIQSAHSFGIITGPILKIDLTLCTPENPAPHESTTVCMLQCSGALLHRKLSLWNLKRACTQNQNCDSDKNEIGKTIAKHLGLEFRLTRF